MPLIAAFLVFIAVSAVAGVVLATFAGVLTVAVSCYALAAGMLAALLAFRSCRGISLEGPGPGFFDKAALFFAFLFCARNFFWLYYYSGEKVYTLNGYPYADLHFHLAFIQNFVSDTPFWPENPLFTGAPLRYHFGMDLFTALFVKAGLPLTRALPLIGFFGGMLTMLALYAWGRGFTVAAFLFTGGMAGYVFFLTHVFDDYQSQLAWKNVALTSLLPQRGFLFGFPAGLVTLWSWRRRILENKKGLPLWIEGLLWGVMPFFQMHAFMFLSGIFALWTVAKKKIRDMMPVYFVALVTAVPFVLILTDNFQKASMIWFKPGWMMETQNPVIFFMLNFGLYCPLALWTAWRVARSRERNAQLMLFPALALFLLCMFVMFGPWEWDNTKLIIWSFLLATPVFDAYVVRRLRFPFRALLLVGLFASGFVCVVSSMGKNNRGIPIVDRQDLDEVCAQMAKIAPTAHVASAQEAYHPVLMCGRKLAAGYAGNLRAAFGLDPENVEAKLQRLMAGEFDWRSLARDLNARYLYWGPFEEKSYPNSKKPWEAASLKIAEGGWGALYDLEHEAPWWPLASGKEGGLKAFYYDNTDWQGEPKKTEAAVWPDFDWDDNTRPLPAPFGIIFEGEVNVPAAGRWTFYLASDDGSDLSIDGATLIDNLGLHSFSVRSGEVLLDAGWHHVRIRYQDMGGGAMMRFWRKPAGGESEALPAGSLRPEAS